MLPKLAQHFVGCRNVFIRQSGTQINEIAGQENQAEEWQISHDDSCSFENNMIVENNPSALILDKEDSRGNHYKCSTGILDVFILNTWRNFGF